MTDLDLQRLDRSIRDRIQLLKTIAGSRAFSSAERKVIASLVDGFLKQINNIKLKLGVIGEFNAGKSTLLNAILGKKVVATSDRPCTPVPVYIEAGMPESLAIVQEDGNCVTVGIDEYSRYTTDGEAPTGIQSIRMTVDSPLLKDNKITLVDTPGINAINPLHTQITESVLPELHAAILLMYSKQPGSKSTIEFLKNAAQQTGKVFICVSKSDFLSEDQLNRIIDALPGRLSNLSGMPIDKIHPIHFDEKGGGEDFYRFFGELKQFMLVEWYQAISKEVEKVLAECSSKIANLVQNKLDLEERLFFDFMKNVPVDFSTLSTDLKEKVHHQFQGTFDEEQFSNHAFEIANKCLEEIQAQLVQDLEPDKSVLLFFDKRVDEKTLKIATDNCNKYYKKLAGIEEHVGKLTQDFVQAVQDLSLSALQSINDILENFRDKVRTEIMARPETIVKARKRRFWRWMAFGLVLSVALLGAAFQPWIQVPNVVKYILFGSVAFAVVFPGVIALKPTQKDLKKLAEKELTELQCFAVPTFVNTHTGQLSIAEIDTSGTFWNKDKQTSFNRTGGQVAHAAYNIGGAAAGFEVAAVLSVVNYTLSFFSKPKAKDVYEEILEQTRQEISNHVNASTQSFLGRKASIQEAAHHYIDSLPERYSAVIQEAFDHNSHLLENRKKIVSELDGFMKQLAKP